MSLMTRELRASYAFVERNFNLTKRYWGWEVAFLVYAVAGALAVSLIGAFAFVCAFIWKMIAIEPRSVMEAKRWIGRIVFGTIGVEMAGLLVRVLVDSVNH